MRAQQQAAHDGDPASSRGWQWMKNHLLMVTALAAILLIAVTIAGYWFGWQWTGLNAYIDPTGGYQAGKTLWDWMDLLIVPVVIGAAAYWFRQTEADNQQRQAE